ncbi:hypothetical protein, partial [Listeria innocua]
CKRPSFACVNASSKITAEFGSLIKELDHVADTTNYNNI